MQAGVLMRPVVPKGSGGPQCRFSSWRANREGSVSGFALMGIKVKIRRPSLIDTSQNQSS